MQLLADGQRDFAAAILDPSLAVPPHLVGPDGEPSPKRFAVYRNNVVVGLTEALRANFPVACRIVGEEFFQEMARAYISSYPPHSPILLDYGISFAGFIADFEPAASLPYLPDVARIERAWTEAYHAHEAEPIDAEVLASIPSDQTANICFAVHPSLRIVRSQFPALISKPFAGGSEHTERCISTASEDRPDTTRISCAIISACSKRRAASFATSSATASTTCL